MEQGDLLVKGNVVGPVFMQLTVVQVHINSFSITAQGVIKIHCQRFNEDNKVPGSANNEVANSLKDQVRVLVLVSAVQQKLAVFQPNLSTKRIGDPVASCS